MKTSRKYRFLKWLIVLSLGIPVLHYAGRVFVADRFGISGVSMAPTLTTGQKVRVNKLLMGPRIYTRFDFSSGCFGREYNRLVRYQYSAAAALRQRFLSWAVSSGRMAVPPRSTVATILKPA